MAERKVTIGLFGDDRDLDQKIADAKAHIDELKAKGAKIPVSLDKTQLDQDIRAAEIKLEELNRKKASPRIDTAKASIDLDKLDLSISKTELAMDKLMAKGLETDALGALGAGAAKAGSEVEKLAEKDLPSAGSSIAQFGSKLGAISNYGMPALITGLVMLGGQLVTVGFGLAAFGAAAFKDLDPILKLSQKTGGLAANLDKLDPVQRKLAISLLGLGQDYNKFAVSLKPEVFSVFGKGLVLVDDLMKDLQPAAATTGKALASVLGSIDQEFQSGEWQKFFGYIEQNAGPDLKQLGTLLDDVLAAIPPLTEALHPLGAALINDLDDVTKFTGGLSTLVGEAEKAALSVTNIGKGHNDTGSRVFNNLKEAAGQVLNPVQAAMNLAGKAGGWIEQVFGGSDKASTAQQRLAQATRAAALAAQNEQKSMDALSTSIDQVTSKILTLQGDTIAWKQAQNSATQTLKQNKDALDGNSDAALADKQALLGSTEAAIQFADHQLNVDHNTAGASKTILSQIAYLQKHGEHSQFASTEILALVQAEAKLPKSVTSKVKIDDTSARDKLAGLQKILQILNGEVVTTYVSTQYVKPGSNAQGKVKRYATGTEDAPEGWAWVGEEGPELIRMTGGETVIPSPVSLGMAKLGQEPGLTGPVHHDRGPVNNARDVTKRHKDISHSLDHRISDLRTEHRQDLLLAKAPGLSKARHEHYAHLAKEALQHMHELEHQRTKLRATRSRLRKEDDTLKETIKAAKAHGLTGEVKKLEHRLHSNERRIGDINMETAGVRSFSGGGAKHTGKGGVIPGAPASIGGSGGPQITIQIMPGGSGLDNMFFTWLSNGIRARGGSPEIITRKVKFA